ncbi:hypothetical protein G7Y79_00047g083480 [Physcia stellaris]|nr:hypothetical protein G7Y79_00047g083480 [Physcia stellaris]
MFAKPSLLLLALSICSAKAATDCFTQVGDAYKVPSNLSHYVSAGEVCDKSGSPSCTVKAEGYVSESATLNITAQDSYFDILEAVQDKVKEPFNRTLVGNITGKEYTLKPGDGGYALFTLNLRCFAGTVGDCFTPFVEPGTYIEACTPTTLNDGFNGDYPTLDGTLRLVTVATDDSKLASLKTNPALKKPDPVKPTTTSRATPSATPTPSGGAAQLSLGVGVMGLIVAGTVSGLL